MNNKFLLTTALIAGSLFSTAQQNKTTYAITGDGNNDFFIVSSHNIKEITYEIYDRWGLNIASYNGITGGWNGETKNGKMATDGVYFYVLKATGLNGKTVQQEGFIHLFSQKD